MLPESDESLFLVKFEAKAANYRQSYCVLLTMSPVEMISECKILKTVFREKSAKLINNKVEKSLGNDIVSCHRARINFPFRRRVIIASVMEFSSLFGYARVEGEGDVKPALKAPELRGLARPRN